jgi:hypothetical protein
MASTLTSTDPYYSNTFTVFSYIGNSGTGLSFRDVHGASSRMDPLKKSTGETLGETPIDKSSEFPRYTSYHPKTTKL